MTTVDGQALDWPAQSLFDASTLPGGRLARRQREGLEWLADKGGSAVLADPTGAGKTATVCAALAHEIEYRRGRRSASAGCVVQARPTARSCTSRS